jgi:hypothetical protein
MDDKKYGDDLIETIDFYDELKKVLKNSLGCFIVLVFLKKIVAFSFFTFSQLPLSVYSSILKAVPYKSKHDWDGSCLSFFPKL